MMLTSRKNFGKDWVAFFLSPHWESKGSELAEKLLLQPSMSWVARNPEESQRKSVVCLDLDLKTPLPNTNVFSEANMSADA